MFNKVLSEIVYEDVLAFCQTFPEGVRVEYKREVVNVPKVVSSFANTVGGIWVIGVDSDDLNRAILPPIGIPTAPGIEEQIVQSTQDGIYPPITPAVRIIEIPGTPGRVLAVVKVSESLDAPHAIEKSTRVYIRIASASSPIELADLDRIEYLLKRREAPERLREFQIDKQIGASPLANRGMRLMRVIVAPVYPRGPLFSYDGLHQRVEPHYRAGHRVLRYFRLVHDGIQAGRNTDPNSHYHFELNTHGVMLFEEIVDTSGAVADIHFIHPIDLVVPLARALQTAIPFFEGSLTNLLIRTELLSFRGIAYLPQEPARYIRAQTVASNNSCLDERIVVSANTTPEHLTVELSDLLSDILGRLLWAFNHRPGADFPNEIRSIVEGNRFV